MTHITNADYQKRLDDLSIELSLNTAQTMWMHKSITALCRDVCGEVVTSGEIPYRKLQPCPSCKEPYMYRCTCSTAGDYVQALQNKVTEAILGQSQEEK